jgi:tetratricopeptide (TPR) repeat protein
MAITTRSVPSSSTQHSTRRRIALAGIGLSMVVGALLGADVINRVGLGTTVSHVGQAPAVAENAAEQPADARAQVVLGFSILQQARETADPTAYGRAEAAFRSALSIEAENVQALIGMGSLSLSRHEFSAALTVGKRALALNRFIPSTYGIIGDAQVELGRYDEALVTVQKMVDLRPDLASFSRVSYQRELHGDLTGAIEAMQLAVAAAGPATENTEYVRVQLGNLQFASGNLRGAEGSYTQALARLPGYHLALAGLGRVAAARGNLPDAVELYQQAIARLPLPETVIGLGEALQAAGHAGEAADQYALVEAMQQLFAANGVRTDLELAAFFADHGNAHKAVQLARAAYAERHTIFAADAMAWSLYQADRATAALPFARESLRLGTQSSRLLYHAGMIEIALGHSAAARRHLRRALDLNPAFSPLDGPRAAAALAGLDR